MKPKDLRDTYCSMLLTLGIPLGWIAKQCGHGNASITTRYYAAWIDSEGYRNPSRVADLRSPRTARF